MKKLHFTQEKAMKELLHSVCYHIDVGTWANNYEYNIEKVKITSITLNAEAVMYANTAWGRRGFCEVRADELCSTLKEAKIRAKELIEEEKRTHLEKIESITEEDLCK